MPGAWRRPPLRWIGNVGDERGSLAGRCNPNINSKERRLTVVPINVINTSLADITQRVHRITEVTMTRFFIVQICSIAFVAALLIAKWATAAELGSDGPSDGCHAYESECSERPLANGRAGETVRVCERVQLVCTETERKGRTEVYHVRGGRLLAAR